MPIHLRRASDVHVPRGVIEVGDDDLPVAHPVRDAGEKSRHRIAGGRSLASRLATRLIGSVAVIGASLGLLTGIASADQFSPYPGTGVTTYYNQFADTCWFVVGPVYDPNGTSQSYAIIGGITVQNCSYRHSFEAYVEEEYASSKAGPWYVVSGSERQAWLPNVYGFGTCSPGCPSGRILETPHICNGPPLYWATTGWVDEYDASGHFIRQVVHYSGISSKPVKAKPSPC